MSTYSIKVDTQNLSKSFIYYEKDKLTLEQAQEKFKMKLNIFDHFLNKGIEPVVYDDRNRPIKVRKMYLVKND